MAHLQSCTPTHTGAYTRRYASPKPHTLSHTHALVQISTILGAAIPSERADNGWVEGVAIWVAVLVVVSVGKGGPGGGGVYSQHTTSYAQQGFRGLLVSGMLSRVSGL